MTTEYSIQKMVSDGTLSTITLGIQYLQRNDIYMRVAGEETPQSGAPSGYTWSFLDNTTLKILPVVPNGVEVVVYRRTDVDAMYNIYSQNAQFDEATIDENNQQLLYIAQEYLEQGLPGAGVDILEFVRDDGINTYYRIKRTDGSYSDEFAVPSAGSITKILAREALRRSYAEIGRNLVDGSFEAGGTLVNANDALLNEKDGKAYSWTGTYPSGGYVVAPGTDPATNSSYVDITNILVVDLIGKLYTKSPYEKTSFKFSSSGQITTREQVVKNTSNSLWYKYTGSLPVSVPSSPDSQWVCVGALNGFPLGDARNFLIDTTPSNISLWLNCGEPILTGLGKTEIAISSTITIPESVCVKDTSFKFSGSANNIVLVSSNCKFYGSVTGTGSTNKVERAFYPAYDGVEGVHIDADISNVTFGVHAQPVTGSGAMPKGWTGVIRAKKIVGATGSSEGYGLLLSPACNFAMTVIGDDVARHVAYLSAGSYSNSIKVWANKCGNIAVQLYSTVGQQPTRDNEVSVWLGNIYNPPGQSGQAIGVVALGNVLGNVVNVNRAIGGDSVVKVEADVANSLYPVGNTFNLINVSGVYALNDVCVSIDGRGTTFNLGMWFAKALQNGIAFRKTTSVETSEFISGEVRGTNMSMAGSSNIGVFGDAGLTVKLSRLNISNDGSSPRVSVDQSKRIGYTREFSSTYNISIAANAQTSQSITLPFQPKKIYAFPVNFSAANTPSVAWVDGGLSSNLTKSLYVNNPSSSSQTITVQVVAEGD